MVYNTVNSYFQSTSGRDHHSRHRQSYHYTRSENTQIHTPQQLRQPESSSVRLPGRSHNMFSMISKFEALDAVSLPIKIPSLQPAHLQISRNSSRRQTGTENTQIKRLSTIFSPRNKSNDLPDGVGHIDELPSGREGSSNIQGVGGTSLLKKPGRGRLRKAQPSIKPTTSASPLIAKQLPCRLQDKGSGDTVQATQGPQEVRLRRRKTIRDIIRFYDGAVSTGTNTKAKPSLAQTPIPRTPPQDRISHINCESCGERSNPIHNGYTRNPIKPAHTTSAKKRNLVFGPTVPNPFLTRSLPSKFAASGNHYIEKQCVSKEVESFSRLDQSGLSQDTTTDRMNTASVESTPTRMPRGRSRGPKPVGRRARHISENRRNISEKIEALYRAKSLECRRENTQVAELALKSPRLMNSDLNGNRESLRKPENERHLTDGTSKVAQMKRKFDERTQQNNQILMGQFLRPKIPAKNFSLPFNTENSVFDCAPEPPPPPPPMPEFSSKRTPVVSPKTIMGPTSFVEIENTLHVRQAQLPQEEAFLAEKRQRAKSKAIEDRVKLFEGFGHQERRSKTKKERSFSGMVGSSITSMRRNFFERAAWRKPDVAIFDERRALTGKEIQSIVDEFQDGAADGKIGTRKTIVGRWNVVPKRQARTSVTRVTDENDRAASYSTESGSDMVVKEARCGLKQPKPMRVTEMKRMVMLCRGKVGTTIGKEKGKAGLSEKL